jgi:uncharacterized protein YodC (DUF2158 family)
MAAGFKVGDVVRLVGGSPALSVEHVGTDGRVDVVWFEGAQFYKQTGIRPDLLILQTWNGCEWVPTNAAPV